MGITIVLPVSRPQYLPLLFARLDMMPCDQENINMLTIVDGDMNLYEKARNFTSNSKYKQKLTIFRGRGPANASSIRRRRQRIADIHNEAKQLIIDHKLKDDYILLLEDDTIPPMSLFIKMKELAETYPFAGIISGVEVGRWGYTHIGAWKVNDIYDPTQITSVENKEGVMQVDATGFYCGLIKKDIYLKHTFKPYDDILGPDFEFGMAMRQQGLINYIDYSLPCSHETIKGSLKVAREEIMQVQFTKSNDKWSLGVVNK